MTIYERYNKQHGKSNKLPSKTVEYETIDNYIDTIVNRRAEIEISNSTNELIDDIINDLQKAINK